MWRLGLFMPLIDSTGLKIYGSGQWVEEKHGTKSRRCWRKLHLAVDADSGEIIAHSLTDQEAGDASQLEPLLDQIDDEIGQFTADGAYDGAPTYDAVLRHSPGARIVVPPRSNAVERPNAQASCHRDDHVASIQADGRQKWQGGTGYGKRALVETAMGRYKGVIGPRMRARSFVAQQTEAAIGVAILNRMLACGRPNSVRCRASAGATK
jgi:transposase